MIFDQERIPGEEKDAGFEYYRHLFAYDFARRFCAGKRVLDLGCGYGYGTAILASSAASASGADFSAAAVAKAGRTYSAVPNVSFSRQDARAMTFKDGEFEVCCSFQVIEHFKEPAAVLSELKRVTAPGGSVIISTLNAEISGSVFNPYHFKEYGRAEFLGLLTPHFASVELYGVMASPAITESMKAFKAKARRLASLDVLGLSKHPESELVRGLYSFAVLSARAAFRIGRKPENFSLSDFSAEQGAEGPCIDFIAVCSAGGGK
ncbi:MAG: class I SAM-dependent methyltransferase [Elusimicrobia bacterium]|nr:class I SAM-dependent methyltransferase [Elusimicrobiota bacterium]